MKGLLIGIRPLEAVLLLLLHLLLSFHLGLRLGHHLPYRIMGILLLLYHGLLGNYQVTGPMMVCPISIDLYLMDVS
jgi:hypothetical protein